jgi:hypothetical protein
LPGAMSGGLRRLVRRSLARSPTAFVA